MRTPPPLDNRASRWFNWGMPRTETASDLRPIDVVRIVRSMLAIDRTVLVTVPWSGTTFAVDSAGGNQLEIVTDDDRTEYIDPSDVTGIEVF